MENEEIRPQRLVTPTTKIRRLGYFAVFCSLIKNELSLPSFSQELLRRKDYLHSILYEYCKSLPVQRRGKNKITGEITGTDSLNRYYSTALEMGLLEELKNTVFLSKRGQILAVLPANSNPFDLTLSQIYFLLWILRQKDCDYQHVLLDIILDHKHYENENQIFRQKVKDIWAKKVNIAVSLGKMQELNDLRKALKGIPEWISPKRYYNENIKATRLEWLLDLKLINYWSQRKNWIKIKSEVALLFQGTQVQYSNIFYECFREHFKKPAIDWQILDQDQRNAWMKSLLVESIGLFGSENVLGKISASQFFEYSTSKLIGEGVISNIRDLERDLINLLAEKKAPYRYVKITSDVDMGYISKT